MLATLLARQTTIIEHFWQSSLVIGLGQSGISSIMAVIWPAAAEFTAADTGKGENNRLVAIKNADSKWAKDFKFTFLGSHTCLIL